MSQASRRGFVVGECADGGMVLVDTQEPGVRLDPVGQPFRQVHVFWELLPDEEKPFQGLPFGTLCALLYEDRFPDVTVLLAAVYEHREEEGYPFRWRAQLAQLPAWLRLACPVDQQTGEWRFPEPTALGGYRRPVWAAVTLPDPKVKTAAREAGLGG